MPMMASVKAGTANVPVSQLLRQQYQQHRHAVEWR